ncbi:MAG: hypothetical protein IKS36_06990 [Bacteroidales bacterium]|nr:hypothetical protein [Bacteroidales bacterium]
MRLLFKKIIPLLIAIVSTTAVRSQSLLTPSNYHPHFLDYEQALHNVLLSYYSRPYNGNIGYDTYFLCNPSFGPNYSLAIRESRYKDTDSLILTRATKNIWYEGAYYWGDKKKRKGIKKIPVERYSVPVKKDFTNQITRTFCSAVMTSSHFADSRMGCDGVTYKFYTSGRMAEVWTPEKDSRTYRLVKMVDSLCIAVERGDTAIIRHQMPICQQLTKEFRSEYPLSHFKADKYQKGDTVNQSVHLWNENMYICITTVADTTGLNGQQTNEQLSLWAKELFEEQYPYKVYITISEDSAHCTFRHLKYDDRVDIAIPARLLNHDFIFNALKLPFGDYRLNERDEWEKID